MDRIGSSVIAVLSFGLLLLVTEPGYAQSARAGGGASAQLMQQMQQLASERTSLQAENAKLKKDLEDMRKERDALKNAAQAVDRRVKSSEIALKEGVAQRATTEQELARTKEKFQQLVDKFRETLQTMHEVETDRATAKQTLTTRDRDLKACVDRNVALYNLNGEVLTQLEHQTVWTHLAQSEPFTKIKRSQLENLVDDYKYRADETRIDPTQPIKPLKSSATPPAPPPAPGVDPPRPTPSTNAATTPQH